MTLNVSHIAQTLLSTLVLVTAVVGTLTVLALAASIILSTWKVFVGKATLVLPLEGSAKGAIVSSVLAQQLVAVERDWIQLSRALGDLEVPHPNAPVYAELGRTVADDYLTEAHVHDFIEENPIDPRTTGPISFAGVTLAPQTLLSLAYGVRRAVARRTIRGTLHEFDTIIRLSIEFHYPDDLRYGSPSDPSSSQGHFVRTVDGKAPAELLKTIDDVAFAFGRFRLRSPTAATRWAAFKASATGYLAYRRFLVTGDVADRERAIESYERAIEIEDDYAVAHYNLGVLLYSRYTETDNNRAITHLTRAAGARGLRPA